jgi:hypothetical protein
MEPKEVEFLILATWIRADLRKRHLPFDKLTELSAILPLPNARDQIIGYKNPIIPSGQQRGEES